MEVGVSNNIQNTTTNEVVYTLSITDEDLNAIHWVGDRYCWASVLGKYCFEEGNVELTQSDVDEIIEDFKRDTEGGHNFFPCLALGSDLRTKLSSLVVWDLEREDQ